MEISLSITRTEYSDSGWYRCVLTKEGQEVALWSFCPVPAVLIGQAQRLHLFSGRDAWTQVVLQWKSVSLFVDPMFEGRVSVPKRIVHGDISLIFNDTPR